MSPVTPPYVAGFIDGEGSLMISQAKSAGSGLPHYRARLAIGNTCRWVLEEMQQQYGGTLSKDARAVPGWKHMYVLVWTGGKVEGVLSMVAPYLILKKAQASVLTDFLRHLEKTRRGRWVYYDGLPEEAVAYREHLYLRMKSLNAKGLQEPESPRRELETVADDSLLGVEPAENHSNAHADADLRGLDVREHRGDPEPIV